MPTGVVNPFVAILSLIVSGTPSRGESGSPERHRPSAARAWANAPSASSTCIALIFGSQAAIRVRTAEVTSTGDRVPSR